MSVTSSVGNSIRGIFVSIGGDSKGLRKEINKAKRALKQAFGREGIRLSQSFASSLKYIGIGMAGVGLASVKMAGDLEQSRIAFETFLGSAEKGKKMIADILTFSAGTPMMFGQLEKASRMLLAFGIESDDIIPSLKMLGDVASGTGADISSLAYVFGKVNINQRMMMKDINQLSIRGIPVLKQLEEKAKSMGLTVRKYVEQGRASFEDLKDALVAMTTGSGRFTDMMRKQSKSLLGLWSTFKDNIFIQMRNLGDALIEALNLKQILSYFIGELQSFKSNVDAIGFKEAFSELFPPELKMTIAGIAGAISVLLVPAIASAGVALFSLLTTTGLLAPMIIGGALAMGIYKIVEATVKLEHELVKVNAAFQLLKSQVIKSAGDIFLTLSKYAIKWLELSEKFYKVGGKVSSTMAQYATEARGAINELKDFQLAIKLGLPIAEKDLKIKMSMVKWFNALSSQTQHYSKVIAHLFERMADGESAFGMFKATILENIPALDRFTKSISKYYSLLSADKIINTGLSDKAKALRTSAKTFSDAIKAQWFSITKTEKAQLEEWKRIELERIETMKKTNSQYKNSLADRLKILEMYEEKKKALESKKGFFGKVSSKFGNIIENNKKIIEAEKIKNQQILESFRRTTSEMLGIRRNAEEQNKALQDGDLERFYSHLHSKEQKWAYYYEGLQQLGAQARTLDAEAHRSNMSYLAEGYRTLYQGMTDGITSVIMGSQKLGEMLQNLGKSLIQMVVGWIVQRKVASVLSASLEKTATASSVAMSKIVAAAWGPAASMVSLATMGANMGPAMASLTATTALASALGAIPMANGGIVTKPTFALIGEAGPEAVIPLSKTGSMGGGNVQVNVFNQTGQPVQAKSKSSFDGARTVVDLWIEGVNRNISGVQDMVGGR